MPDFKGLGKNGWRPEMKGTSLRGQVVSGAPASPVALLQGEPQPQFLTCRVYAVRPHGPQQGLLLRAVPARRSPPHRPQGPLVLCSAPATLRPRRPATPTARPGLSAQGRRRAVKVPGPARPGRRTAIHGGTAAEGGGRAAAAGAVPGQHHGLDDRPPAPAAGPEGRCEWAEPASERFLRGRCEQARAPEPASAAAPQGRQRQPAKGQSVEHGKRVFE